MCFVLFCFVSFNVNSNPSFTIIYLEMSPWFPIRIQIPFYLIDLSVQSSALALSSCCPTTLMVSKAISMREASFREGNGHMKHPNHTSGKSTLKITELFSFIFRYTLLFWKADKSFLWIVLCSYSSHKWAPMSGLNPRGSIQEQKCIPEYLETEWQTLVN